MKITITFFLLLLCSTTSFSQEISVTGNIEFFDSDVSYIKVYLKDDATALAIDSSTTSALGEFHFPSSDSISISSGEYYLEISTAEFSFGGKLHNISSCEGFVDANIEIDHDDNGMDQIPSRTTTFDLVAGHIDHIDFCFHAECSSSLLATPFCHDIEEADILCSIETLSGMCSIMHTIGNGGDQPSAICDFQGTVDNSSWVAFVASAGEYSFSISPIICEESLADVEGIQVEIFTDCSYTESVYCNADTIIEPIIIESNLLTPGQVYYLLIDGYAASVCHFTIAVDGNLETPILSPDELCIKFESSVECNETEYCVGIIPKVSVTGIDIKADYHWEITTLSGGPYEANPTPITEENYFGIDITNEGMYEVCLTGIDNGCQFWSGNECISISTFSPSLLNEIFNDVNLCTSDIENFNFSIFDDQDPNGDETFGWQGSTSSINFGFNSTTITTPEGCIYAQSFFLNEIPEPQLDFIDSLCIGDSIIIIIENEDNLDSIHFFEDGMPLGGDANAIFPSLGLNVYTAMVFSSCGNYVENFSVFVSDTISNPTVYCDTSNVGSILFSWSEIEGAQGYSLIINDNEEVISTDTFYNLTDLENGEAVNLKFTLLDPSKCILDFVELNCSSAMPLSLDDLHSEKIHIYPNPVLNSLLIQEPKLSANSSFQIIDYQGKIVQHGLLNQTQIINLNALSQGMYLIKIQDSKRGFDTIEKFVKI